MTAINAAESYTAVKPANDNAPRAVDGAKPPKIVVIGAGSAIFGLGSLATMMQYERLRGAELALVDIDDSHGLGSVSVIPRPNLL
jgi:hypothetical protein